MRVIQVTHIILLGAVVLLSACGGVSQSKPAPATQVEASAPAQQHGLPALSALDGLRAAVAIQGLDITVTEPTWEQHTTVDGASLRFTPPADELGYAIYRVEPPWGIPQRISAAGEGPLWLAVADYGAGRWVFVEFAEGQAEIDLTQLANPLSPEGYLYPAVICPGGAEGRLDTLTLHYDDLSEAFGDWGLVATADDSSITLTWNELPADSYRVLRSTLSADEAPYEVGSVTEQHAGGNTFTETVPSDGKGRWVPQNNDNGTPDDTSDDFPTIAPAVAYYYRLVPVLHGDDGPASPEVTATAAWGDRRTARREWPDSTAQTQLFGMWIEGSQMTAPQIQWCANNLVGACGLRQSEIDAIRAYNPDFIALNSSFAYMASAEWQTNHVINRSPEFNYVRPLYYGDEIDGDGQYPYLNRHEDLFLHDPGSTQPSQRVSTNSGYEWLSQYWLDIDSAYRQYKGSALMEILGEDGADGWIEEGCASYYIGYSDAFYQQYGAANVLEYFTPRMGGYLSATKSRFDEHPLAPYLIADAWMGIDNIEDDSGPFPCLDYTACDGVLTKFIEGYNDDGTGGGLIWGFENGVGPNIFQWQQAGQAVILDADVDSTLDSHHALIDYCCYLLLRNSKTYFYMSCIWRQDQYVPQWYPMYSWDSGAPLGPQPQSIADLAVGSDYYRHFERRFENGTVIVAPGGAMDDGSSGKYYEYLDCTGGGVVAADGSVSGEAVWTPCHVVDRPGYELDGPGAWIIRERPAA